MAAITAGVLGAAVGAGGSLLGGFLSDRNARLMNSSQISLAKEQMAMQREFAQSGIRWRVADAKAAGIHPLYSLGATLSQPSPVSVNFQAQNNMGKALAQSGQNIGRAIAATRTAPERTDVMLRELQLERGALENEQIRLQNRRLVSQIGPPMAGTAVLPPEVVEKELPTLGGPMSQDPGYADAEEWEKRYGEPGEWIGGFQNLGVDAWRSAKKGYKRRRKIYGRSGKKALDYQLRHMRRHLRQRR